MTGGRATIDEAARVLKISKEAVRKRIKRGSLKGYKDEAGRWIIDLPDTDRTSGQDTRQDEGQAAGGDASAKLVQVLQDEILFLRQELSRKDQILYMMAEKLPQLEAPKQETPEKPKETQTEEPEKRWWQVWK